MAENQPLSLVRPEASPPATFPSPPRHLGDPGMSLWVRVTTEYAIVDAGGVELLAQACAALDRAEALAACIDRDGLVLYSKSGARAHPAIKEELACRAFICRTLTRLGLNIETVKPIGRPGGHSHWTPRS